MVHYPAASQAKCTVSTKVILEGLSNLNNATQFIKLQDFQDLNDIECSTESI
jgi:hypothetical protein